VFAAQVAAGTALRDETAKLKSDTGYGAWKLDRQRWIDVTKEALRHVYEGDHPTRQFDSAARPSVVIAGEGSAWQSDLEDDKYYLSRAINKLVSFRDSLPFAEEPALTAAHSPTTPPAPATQPARARGLPGAIFIVHGRDEGRRETVARFLERAGNHQYETVLLDEQASRGRTLIEKFEAHAAETAYAVVLLTGEDMGGLTGGQQRPRARQNVVFELGFFFGALGRHRVTVLYEPDVEKPSDVDGLAYVPLDVNWQQRLVRELAAAGLDFSLDRL
jgi:hypothetical protein